MHEETARVRRVIDGDTIAVETEDGIQRVRMAHIDAPEDGQPFCRESREKLREKIGSDPVTITWKETDRYGRWIAEVINKDGLNLNVYMITNGWAWAKEYRGKRPDLEEVSRLARQEKRGIFQGNNAIRPWEFRKK